MNSKPEIWYARFVKSICGPKLCGLRRGRRPFAGTVPFYVAKFLSLKPLDAGKHSAAYTQDLTWGNIEDYAGRKFPGLRTAWVRCEIERPAAPLLEDLAMSKTRSPLKRMLKLIADAVGAREPSVAAIEKAVYKYTDCGAWADVRHRVVMFGSIVEGVDVTTEVRTLRWPFTAKQVHAAIATVEEEARYIWDQTHGCDDCGAGKGEWGGPMINPACKTCKGAGIVI